MISIVAAAFLVFHLAVLWWHLFGRARAGRRIAVVNDPAARRARYRRWLRQTWLLFGLPPLLTLAALGALPLLAGYPRALLPLTLALGGFMPVGELLADVVIASTGAAAVLAALFALQRWRRWSSPGIAGDFAAVLPQTRGELAYGAVLALSAGVAEELFFRLSLPLLVVLVGGGAWLAVALATILFGAVHRYQGWRGMVATAMIGALYAAVYALSGALWLAMLAHALLDVVAMVWRPILAGAWRRR